MHYRRLAGGTDLGATLRPGWHIIPPWDRLFSYALTPPILNGRLRVVDVEGRTLLQTYQLTYHPEPAKLPQLHQQLGPNYAAILVRPELERLLRTTSDQPSSEERLAAALANRLHPHGVIVDRLVLGP